MSKRTAHYNGEPVEAYPLHWPTGRKRTKAHDRRRAQFGRLETNETSTGWKYNEKKRLTVHGAIRRLINQVDAFTRRGHVYVIDPATVVVSSNVRTRNDGLPYSNAAEPDDPGVAVYFELEGEPHCLACDTWDRVADNIAAVAKHLEAMRGMERWGVGDLRTHFAGFKALPGGNTVQPAMTLGEAAGFVEEAADQGGLMSLAQAVIDDVGAFKRAMRYAAKRCHPDTGGSEDEFKRLQEAKRVLDEHHGL